MRIKKETRLKARSLLSESLSDGGNLGMEEACVLIRKMMGQNQAEFAEFVGVNVLTIKKFETGKGNLSLATLDKIFGRFDMELCVRKKV